MTDTLHSGARTSAILTQVDDALRARLDELLAERDEVAEEAALPPVGGDMADRTQNVDALIRLATLDQHIEDLQVQLQQPQTRAAKATDGASTSPASLPKAAKRSRIASAVRAVSRHRSATGRCNGPRIVLALRRTTRPARRSPGRRSASACKAIVASSRASGCPRQ